MDKLDWKNAKCEVCFVQASIQVFDLVERFDPRSGLIKVTPYGRPHLFCDDHKRESAQIKFVSSAYGD